MFQFSTCRSWDSLISNILTRQLAFAKNPVNWLKTWRSDATVFLWFYCAQQVSVTEWAWWISVMLYGQAEKLYASVQRIGPEWYPSVLETYPMSVLQKPLGVVELAIILLGVVLSPQCKSAAVESPGRAGERKVMRLQREPTSHENFFSTTCLLCSPAVPHVNVYVPLDIIIPYILSQQFIPRTSVRLSFTPPILLFNTFFEEMSSKQDRKNPEYDPWRKNKRVKKDWRSGTLQRWQEPGLVQPPAEKQLSFCGFPYDSMLCPPFCTPSQHPPHWLSHPSEIRHLAAGSCYFEVCGGVFPQEDSFQWHFWSASLLSPNL